MNRLNRSIPGLFALLAVCASASVGAADEIHGDAANTNLVSCASDPVSSIVSVCNTVKQVFPFIACPAAPNSCVKPKREIFTGLTVEGATPANIKTWNGQGGDGELFQKIGVCLLRDLNWTPMTSHSEAQLSIGTIAADGLVSYKSFDKTGLRFEGFHSLRAHAPVIGDIDIFTQPFSFQAVSQDLKGQGLKVGGYDVYGAQALELEAGGGLQGFDFNLDAIQIVTPYGTVSPQPHVGFAQAFGWSMSPYGNAKTMLLNPGKFQVTDIYGRLGGQQLASSLTAMAVATGKPGPGCFSLQTNPNSLCPTPTGWDSQVMLGSRNVELDLNVPGNTPWLAPGGAAFPLRPDDQATRARGDVEKNPNGAATAGVKIVYSPTRPLPSFPGGIDVAPKLDVFVDPNIGVFYGSSFNLWNGQVGTWLGWQGPPSGSASLGTPVDVESLHSMALYGGSSVYGRFALDAGVDIVIHIHIWLPKVCNPFNSDECWPDDIDFNIVDLHPRTTFVESKKGHTDAAQHGAFVLTDWQNFLKSKQLFKSFTPLGGGAVDGIKYVYDCLKQDAPPQKPPPSDPYVPGDPSKLVDDIEMPCNICAGMPDYTYNYPVAWDNVTHHVTQWEKRTLKGFSQRVPPLVTAGLSPADQWECGGAAPSNTIMAAPASAVKNIGCYDQCKLNKANNTFTVVESAKQLFAEGKIPLKGAPNGCH